MPLYFHGTTSATLVGLKKTGFKLTSVSNMMMDHNFAPLAGEIYFGGQKGATSDAGIAFAHERARHYNLDKLQRCYGKITWEKKYHNQEEIIAAVQRVNQQNLTYIKPLIVGLMRDIQMGQGVALDNDIVDDLCSQLTEGLNAVKREYIRNYLVTKYLRRIAIVGEQQYSESESESESESDDEDNSAHDDAPSTPKAHSLFDYTLVCLGFIDDHLVNEIPLNFLECDEEERQAFLRTMPVLFSNLVDRGISFQSVKPNSKQLSDFIEIVDIEQNSRHRIIGQDFHNTITDPKSGENFYARYLFSHGQDPLTPINHDELKHHLQIEFEKLEGKVNQLKRVLRGEVNELTAEEKALCTDHFPLVFVFDPDKSQEKIRKVTSEEYRANELEIGKDIKLIATDNIENVNVIKQILEENAIEGVDVITIEALKSNPQHVALPPRSPFWSEGSGSGLSSNDAVNGLSTRNTLQFG